MCYLLYTPAQYESEQITNLPYLAVPMKETDLTKILEVEHLQISFEHNGVWSEVVRDISFELKKGQSLGVVGESGSGKTVASLSILNLLPSSGSKSSGRISVQIDGQSIDMLELEDPMIYEIRGKRISMVFQEPSSRLNPVRKCGDQVKEVLEVHNIGLPSERRDMVRSYLKKVALEDIDRIYNAYPYELSGGQLQRINIAIALITKPDIIICDEPTTGLDVTTQAEILALLDTIVKAENMAMLFISHDLDVVASICDSIVVVKDGIIIEYGHLPAVFHRPKEAYTRALLACKPRLDENQYALPTISAVIDGSYKRQLRNKKSIISDRILEVRDLTVSFWVGRSGFLSKDRKINAIDGISFSVNRGSALGIVGASGSGKSTLAHCIAGLIRPDAGTLEWANRPYDQEKLKRDTSLRRSIQMIFQDPYSSLDPIMTVGKAVEEPIRYHHIVPGEERLKYVEDLFEKVGLSRSHMNRMPHELSGGQRQRVCIARALGVRPELLICDESVTALDVSVQAQILNLLDQLSAELELTVIFISHDLSVVYQICDEVIVLQSGQIVERGSIDQVIGHPQDPYTRQLIRSIPGL